MTVAVAAPRQRGCLPLTASNDASFFLDLLRVVASALVVFGHAISFYRQYPSLDYPSVPYLQNFAVVLFFLISNFLIAHTIRKGLLRPRYGFGRYAIGRIARIYSGYFPALVFVTCVDGCLLRRSMAYDFGGSFNAPTFVANFFMLQDLPGRVLKYHGNVITSFGSARPFWTLAIEMWIYLFVGAVVLLRRGRERRVWPLLVIGIFAYVPLANLVGGRGRGLFACWLLGAVSEWILYHDVLRRLASPLLVVAGAIAFTLYVAVVWPARDVYQLRSYGFLFAAFTAFVALSLRSSSFGSRRWLTRPIAYVAGYTFTLYLVHYTVIVACMDASASRSVSAMWSAIATSNVVALAIAQFTERRHGALARLMEARLLRTRVEAAG